MKFPKVSDLKDERSAKVQEIEKLYEAASKRDASGKLTEEESKRFEQLDAEIRDLDKQIENAKRAAELAKSNDDSTDDGQQRGQKPHVTGMRDLEAEKPFGTFAEQLRAIAIAQTPGCEIDRRLLHINEVAFRATGASAGVGSDGGFFVGATHAKEILGLVFDTGRLPGEIRNLPLEPGTDRIVIPTVDETSRVAGNLYGGIVGYWKGEGQAYTASRPKFGELELKLKKLTALYFATDELMKNAPAQEAFVKEGVRSVFGYMLDSCIMSGNGANKGKGYLNSGAVESIAKESGQAAATILVANLGKMEARLPDACENTAIWVAHKATKAQLLQLTIGNWPAYMPPGGLSGSPNYGMLLGRKILFSEHCAPLGTVNDIQLIDPKQMVSIKQGEMEIASSIHVQFIYGEQCFRFTYHYDCQPVLNKAITPATGSDKLTPFITLATRA